MKINKIIEYISKKNKINLRKDKEIKLLGAQLVKLKKYLKNGNLDKIQNEPEIELQGDEDSSEVTGQIDGETQMTEKTGYDENNDNNINNVMLNKNGDINNNLSHHEENNDEVKNSEKEPNDIFVDNEDENEEHHDKEEKSQNEENDGNGDNIVSGENNEISNSIENKTSSSREADD